MADFSALKTAIQTYIKQNGNEEITGEILQEILLSVVTTLGDTAINNLVTALADEVAARQNADGTLQQNITNEATARANADTALSNRLGSTITAENTAADQIGAEAEARAAADTALHELIDGITDNIENGYVYAGIATPSSTPASGKVFYLALTAGTYTNFGSTEVSQGINILKYNGSAWSLDAFIGIDDTPTPNSPKLVKSGGAFESVMANSSAFDISAHFASGGTLATYADLSAALNALDTLSASYKRGGMSIKFVQSSDNKYIQARLMSDSFTTDVTQWQGVDDEPTAGSKNLVDSNGVYKATKIVEPSKDTDLSISDERGYAIAQFKNGHIKTKNFDSENPDANVVDVEDMDFNISDVDGNEIARFKNGGIRTKNFDSESLNGFINKYRGKKFSLLGDSISTFGTPSSTNEDGTYCYSYYPNASCRYSEDGVDSIQFDVENTYWMKLIRKTGMILGINDSYRGTLVSGMSNSFNLQTRINHLGLNGTPDVILVYGGTNDAGNSVEIGTFNTENPQNYTDEQIASLPVTTFADAYRTMLIRLMKTYPLAELIVVLPTFTSSYYTITNLDLYVEVIKEACDFFGIKYIDARCTGINIYNKGTYLVDGIHPNVKGMTLLFEKIYKHLIFD